jgi:hypothetical protein
MRLFALALCATALAATDAPVAAPKPYPLTTCIVAGGPLDGMGGAIARVHAGQEVQFCCAGCILAFEKEPAKYLAKLTPPPVQPKQP